MPRERWELLQAVLRERGAPGRHPSRKSLLIGFVVCGACEARMVRAGGRDSDGGYTRHYWRCPARVPRDSCGRVSIDADSLETLVVESVHRAVDTQSVGAAWFDDEDKTESASLAAQLDALDLRRRDAAGSYAAGTLPLAAL